MSSLRKSVELSGHLASPVNLSYVTLISRDMQIKFARRIMPACCDACGSMILAQRWPKLDEGRRFLSTVTFPGCLVFKQHGKKWRFERPMDRKAGDQLTKEVQDAVVCIRYAA